jgi:formylglycine-generating enzyme required for sulfatase activity
LAGTVVLAVLVAGGLAFIWQRGPPATGAESAGKGETTALPVSAEPPPDRLTRDCPTCPELVLIPPGSLTMGVPPEEDDREGVSRSYDDDARPSHKVTIAHAFWLGRYSVTRGEYGAFVEETGYQGGGSFWHDPGFPQTDRDPVVDVSATDAAAYARWLSRKTGKAYRLPSEAEWEYAARAGTTSPRYWGDDLAAACTYANVADETLRKNFQGQADKDRYFPCDDGYANTSPAGTFQPNGFGLSDMLGNVWQWVADPWHDNYQGAPTDGSVWATEGATGRRVLRGGSWSGNPGGVRAGTRGKAEPGIRFNNGGFRVARSP